jgi:hypothetical protein
LASASSRVEHPTTKLSRWGVPLSIGKWTSTTKASSTYLGIPRICAGSHPFPALDTATNQTEPTASAGSLPVDCFAQNQKKQLSYWLTPTPWRLRGRDRPRPSCGDRSLISPPRCPLRSFPTACVLNRRRFIYNGVHSSLSTTSFDNLVGWGNTQLSGSPSRINATLA